MSFEAMKNNLFQNIKNSAFASSMLLGILFSPVSIQAKTVEEVPHSKSSKNEEIKIVSSTKEQSQQTDHESFWGQKHFDLSCQ